MSLCWWFQHLSCSWAEICQIFRWFFGKFKKPKRHSENNWPLVITPLHCKYAQSTHRDELILSDALRCWWDISSIFIQLYHYIYEYFVNVSWKRSFIKISMPFHFWLHQLYVHIFQIPIDDNLFHKTKTNQLFVVPRVDLSKSSIRLTLSKYIFFIF